MANRKESLYKKIREYYLELETWEGASCPWILSDPIKWFVKNQELKIISDEINKKTRFLGPYIIHGAKVAAEMNGYSMRGAEYNLVREAIKINSFIEELQPKLSKMYRKNEGFTPEGF